MSNKTIKASQRLLTHWQQLLQDKMPPLQWAQALCDLLAQHPYIHQAVLLTWQEISQTYQQDSLYPRLPPGPENASKSKDTHIKQTLKEDHWLDLATVYQTSSWLGGKLKRSGWEQGLVINFAPQKGVKSVLAINTHTHSDNQNHALAFLVLSLESIAKNTHQYSNTYRAHSLDPHPTAICELGGQIVHASPTLYALAKREHIALEQCFAANHTALIAAALKQSRAIENVTSRAGQLRMLWVYIPINEQQVLLRGVDATERLTQEKAAATAQRLYRVITENTTDLISRHTLAGEFLDASPASWTLLGYWPEELRGTSTRDLFHPKDLALLQQDAVSALQELGYHTMTYRLQHKDGHYLWFETASRAIRETYTGDVVEVVSVSRDITARVDAEENRRRLAEVVEANTDLVLFVNLQGTLTYANKAARQALGLKLESLSSLADIFDHATFDALQTAGWRHAIRRGFWTHEAQLYSANQTHPLPVSVVLLAHKSAGGERYFSLIMRDMTERALREAEQRQYQADKAHSARLIALGELASGIAHEMNQPLAAISNYAAASQRHLQQLPDSAHPAAIKVDQGLARISHQAHHASEVIRRLRAFLRKGQRRLEPLLISQVIEDTLHLCQWELEREHIRVNTQILSPTSKVYADRTLLEQVLLNLVRNAIEANRMVHQGSSSEILLSVSEGAQHMVIEVSDQGPGADQSTLTMMFTPFFTRKEDGLGLGLSMSRSIVEGFGGDLTAELNPNSAGLLLRCTLPIVKTQKEIT